MTDTEGLRAALEREPPSGAAFGAGLPATEQGKRRALETNFSKRQTLNQNRASMARDELSRERSQLDTERDALQQAVQPADSERPPHGVEEGKGSDDGRSVLFAVLPQRVSIERNALKDADTCKIGLDFRDVPVDPRIVRSCFVSVTLGTVAADDYEAGVGGKLREDGSLRSVVGRDPGQELSLQSSTRFSGFVDEWQVSYGDEGDVIELTCRDVSAVLRDQPMTDQKGQPVAIDLTQPVAKGVQAVLDAFVATRGIVVKFGTPIDPSDPLAVVEPDFGPVPASIMPKTAKRKKGKQARTPAKVQNQNLWDHVTDVVLRLGLVPCLRGFTLFLLEPRVVFADLQSARRMVWGRNLKSLKFRRRLGGMKAETIEIRCADPTIGRTRWARFPVLSGPKSGIIGKPGSPQPETSRPSNVTPNGSSEDRIRVLSVQAVSDLATLERIAENTFHEIGRQEIEGDFETDDIASFESEEEADLLRMLSGEAIQIQVASPEEAAGPARPPIAEKPNRSTSNLQDLQVQSAAAREDYLVGLGVSRETARRLAIAQEQVRLVSSFRLGQLRIEWDQDEGVSVSGSFFNFIVVRESPEDVSGKAPAAKTLSQAARVRRPGVTT